MTASSASVPVTGEPNTDFISTSYVRSGRLRLRRPGWRMTWRDAEWIVSLIDARAPKPGPRGPYKKRGISKSPTTG